MSPSATLSDALSTAASENLYVMMKTVAKEIVKGTIHLFAMTLTDPACPSFLVSLMLTNPTRSLGSSARISTDILPHDSIVGIPLNVVCNIWV